MQPPGNKIHPSTFIEMGWKASRLQAHRAELAAFTCAAEVEPLDVLIKRRCSEGNWHSWARWRSKDSRNQSPVITQPVGIGHGIEGKPFLVGMRFLLVLFFMLASNCYVAEDSNFLILELLIPLGPPPECWGGRPVPSCLTYVVGAGD